MSKVFLGGTCNNSTWREELIPMIKMPFFNPVVKDWTSACQEEELIQRAECDFVLYVITSEMIGVYSVAEAVDDSNQQPDKTMFCFLDDGFTQAQAKSLLAVERMIVNNGGYAFDHLTPIADFLNAYHEDNPE